ncbi:TolC family protein [Massilia sp. DWR3-1-1]|uniref:TolC family protein n=1 Tax=Massilia sp. DWR3-1-1 TaxID=2804559 RepID=UPI003CF677D9
MSPLADVGRRAGGLLAALLAALSSGCASVSSEPAFAPVSALAAQRLDRQVRQVVTDNEAAALAQMIGQVLRQPLQADDAVQIALLNHRGLQAAYWQVGIAQSELVQAGRLRNPSLGFQRSGGGGALDIERSVTLNLASVLLAPLATRIEQGRFEQTWLLVAGQMLDHAAATRRAWFEAVAAQQARLYALQVHRAAAASAALTERMANAGNTNALELARERLFRAEAAAAVVRADQRALAAREALTRLMGLWGAAAADYVLPQRLPDLPAAPLELPDAERIAVRERLDIRAAQSAARHTAAALGLSRTTGFINVLDLGYLRKSADGHSTGGYAISLELPLFDWGTARVAKAEATYRQALEQVAQTAVAARSEARESYLDYRSAYDLATRYRDEVIPLRKKIADETGLRYNGMLISVFELLADAREQAAAVSSAIEAYKQFWIAHTRLEAALGGRLLDHPSSPPPSPSPSPSPAPGAPPP